MLKQIIGGVTIAACALLSGCEGQDTSFRRAQSYMQNRPQLEQHSVISGINNLRVNSIEFAQAQAKLDSVAFRDIFNSTQAVKDSNKVAEFNKLIKVKSIKYLSDLNSNLIKTSQKYSEYNNIKNKADQFKNRNRHYEYIQYATDSLKTKYFFDKYKLLDKESLSKFNKVCSQICPKIK